MKDNLVLLAILALTRSLCLPILLGLAPSWWQTVLDTWDSMHLKHSFDYVEDTMHYWSRKRYFSWSTYSAHGRYWGIYDNLWFQFCFVNIHSPSLLHNPRTHKWHFICGGPMIHPRMKFDFECHLTSWPESRTGPPILDDVFVVRMGVNVLVHKLTTTKLQVHVSVTAGVNKGSLLCVLSLMCCKHGYTVGNGHESC